MRRRLAASEDFLFSLHFTIHVSRGIAVMRQEVDLPVFLSVQEITETGYRIGMNRGHKPRFGVTAAAGESGTAIGVMEPHQWWRTAHGWRRERGASPFGKSGNSRMKVEQGRSRWTALVAGAAARTEFKKGKPHLTALNKRMFLGEGG